MVGLSRITLTHMLNPFIASMQAFVDTLSKTYLSNTFLYMFSLPFDGVLWENLTSWLNDMIIPKQRRLHGYLGSPLVSNSKPVSISQRDFIC